MPEQILLPEQQQTPPCPYFGDCGGCQWQHLAPQTYAKIKEQRLDAILRDVASQDTEVLPMVPGSPQSRRRATLQVGVQKKQVRLGFYGAKQHDVVAIGQCLVLHPQLNALLEPWQQALQGLKKPSTVKSIQLTLMDGGIDATVFTTKPLKEADKKGIAAFADVQGIARLSAIAEKNTPERLYGQADIWHDFSGVAVAMPPAPFLQASEEAAKALVNFVKMHSQNSVKVADLYAGCGPYSFAVAPHVQQISAYEAAAPMMTALINAARRAGGTLEPKIYAYRRDLFKNPLSAEELQSFDTVIINPPRAGAKPQTAALAGSAVAKIMMISCNPITFLRDAKLLQAGGYTLQTLMPVDQFYWSRHLEQAAVFAKKV